MALWEILCLLIFLEKSWGQEQTYGVQTIQDKYKVDSPAISTAHFEMKGTDGSSKRIIRTRRDLQQKLEEQVATYKHPVIKKCCYDGARLNIHETCGERAARITIGPRCITAFNQCCTLANQFRTLKEKLLHFGKKHR
ncbi:complement C5-like isoform 2-T2 [Thomomys bottae]